jgi:hypothetical protein
MVATTPAGAARAVLTALGIVQPALSR